MAEQLAFDLPKRSALGREDFYVTPANALALSIVESWHDWPSPVTVLAGETGSGKSHLAHVFAAASGGRVLHELTQRPDEIAVGPVALDDADQLTDEDALFHLYNLMAATGQPLLLTANSPPSRWNVNLPDLKSRLQSVQVAQIDPPDDQLLGAVLAKHFVDRQLSPPNNVIPYLVRHMDRSLAEAGRLVEAIDRAALKDGRNITRSFVAEVLDRMP